MNTANLKAYAPKARRDFIAAVSKQAEKYGVTAKAIHPVQTTGDVCVVNGRPFPSRLALRIRKLGELVKRSGFEQTMEQVAYSWFNRIIAIRYMELHDYLGHGRRVLSHQGHPTGFQILDECADITYGQGGQLPHLSQAKVLELKLDGTKDEELYRELLLAQCHALHQAMPFLFETVDDETELLLPENLTKTDSLLHDLVTEIPEADWANIEIIGWLYQFYISEKKDQVIGKVVKSEDIPAATQLFTPNWIVKYMVQNSLGAQWLATYPDSPLKAQMEYYIEPAEQTDAVNAQLKEITPESLNPEEITLIDPASGSGHILVEAYDLFKAIYLERGYRLRDIAQLILENNLFGLDIDQRAAQLTGFALMMKGRKDDRRFFERGLKLNVMALVDSTGLDADTLIHGVDLTQYGLQAEDLTELKALFDHATTFGSLIQVPRELSEKLFSLKKVSEATSQDMFVSEELRRLGPLVQQAEILAAQYDAVVANPPYMGSGAMNALVKKFTKVSYPDGKNDLFTCFIDRGYTFAKYFGHNAMVTMQNWMFLTSFETMRKRLLRDKTIRTMAQIGYNSFPSMNSKVAQATVFSLANNSISGFVSAFINLNNAPQSADKNVVFLAHDPANRFEVSANEFEKIPGSPVAYWAKDEIRNIFSASTFIKDVAPVKQGLATSDNERFIRLWHECDFEKLSLHCVSIEETKGYRHKWYPHNKGGEFRKWFGNNYYVVNWQNNGEELWAYTSTLNQGSNVRLKSREYYFKESATWSDVTSGAVSSRYIPSGFIFDTTGPSIFDDSKYGVKFYVGLLNTKLVNDLVSLMNPTLHFTLRDANHFPLPSKCNLEEIYAVVDECIRISKLDWDGFERSWDFSISPLLTWRQCGSVESSFEKYLKDNQGSVETLYKLEEANNKFFEEVYGIHEPLNTLSSRDAVTLTKNPGYRYGGNKTEQELQERLTSDSVSELISYSIGCIMGRYSLDTPGLIYAHSGNEGFDPSRYITFPADDDGIVPLTDTEWYADDATNRVVEFISIAWDALDLEINLDFLAANLSPKKGESSRDTIRRYLCDSFYKDHMQTYKKRPIYWLFSSGKQKAFQCLVYLHRYNEGTLARMRTEYVIPLTAKLSSHIDKLDNDKLVSGSAAEIKKLENEIKRLQKQQTELTEFDEKLKHLADQRIKLDLDDGVKVNYGKFGDLLAEVKAIHGKTAD
jgi:type II restriction/modification system DNA methylase subunit YeeA